MNWIDDIIEGYYKWLKENTSYKAAQDSGWCRITTPFVGTFNDPIEIYVKNDNGMLTLSDDGITIDNLELCGVDISRSPKRREWMDYITRNYGVQIENKELVVYADTSNVAQRKHNLICAVGELSSLEITAKHMVSSMFREDVKAMLDEQELIYTPQFIAKGCTGIDFTFDFQIAGRTNETVIKTFNSLNKVNVPNFLFGWEDVKVAREKASGKVLKGLAIVNDVETVVKNEYLNAMQSKGADYILWSERMKPDNINKLRMAV